MKITIVFTFQDGPWGGGNQFLKALRKEWTARGIYTDSIKEADAVLFNSHHDLRNVLHLKRRYPEKVFIHRIDGPIFFIRNKDSAIDDLIFAFSDNIADLSIFQSHWSMRKCQSLGFRSDNATVTIYNAPNTHIFNAHDKAPFQSSGKTSIIITSWSPNMNKGFDIYDYIDKHLDFNRYTCTFIGNTPIAFKNIHHIPPLPSDQLADALRKADIFLTASKNDPCSNALIEALSCGLPAVVLADGGHQELVRDGGEIFHSPQEVITKIDHISAHYAAYQKRIPQYDITTVAQEYADAIMRTTASKKLSTIKYLQLLTKLQTSRIISFLQR